MAARDTESALQALQWIEDDEAFDLAVLDMHMPEMDGLTLARRIRALRPALPLVLFSSLGRRESGDSDGLFTAYLAKPVRQSQLFDTLANLFARDVATQSGGGQPGRASTARWPRTIRCASCLPRTTS